MNFLFDAQMPARLAKGLEVIDQENNDKVKTHCMFHADDIAGKGSTDEQIIHKANEMQAIIISEDDDFRRIKSNKALVKKFKLGYVLYKPPQHGARYWEKVSAFILGWEKLKKMIEKSEKPFIFKIDKKGDIHTEEF